MEYFQMDGAYSNNLVQLLDHFRADQNSQHIINGIIQMPIKH